MTIKEFIADRYKVVVADMDLDDIKATEENFRWTEIRIYGKTIGALGNFLAQSLNEGGNIRKSGTITAMATDIIDKLLYRIALHELEPKTDIDLYEYGYEDQYKWEDLIPEFKEQSWIMQFTDGYIAVQTPKSDVLHFIELCIKLNILKFDKE